MRSMVARHRLVVVAATAASVALVAACAPPNRTPGPAGGSSATPGATPTLGTVHISYAPGLTLVADGSTTVKVGDTAVTFPTKVTDPSFSPDGSRIAFIDGNGNVATARPDGTGLLVLTTARSGLVRSRPTWHGALVVYGVVQGRTTPTLMAVHANGARAVGDVREFEFGVPYDSEQQPSMSAPSGAEDGAGRELAFQSTSGGAGEVWVADLNGRSPYASKLANGTEPALSRDGRKVAYVGRNGQISVVDAVVDYGRTPTSTQVSFGVSKPSHLAWSADGRRIVFRTPADVESVAATVAPGATSNPTARVSPGPGAPTVLPTPVDTIMHVAGADPVAAAIAVSRLRWATHAVYSPSESSTTADGAMLVGTGDPAAAVPAAIGGSGKGPLLFTGAGSLDPRTRSELRRVIGTVPAGQDYRPTITLVGDVSMISTATENAVRALGYATERIAGRDAASINASMLDLGLADGVDTVAVASADDVAAMQAQFVIRGISSATVVVSGGTLSSQARLFLNRLKPGVSVYALDRGAQSALAASWPGKHPLAVTVATNVGQVMRERGGQTGALIVVDRSSASDIVVADALTRSVAGTVLVIDSRADLDPDVKAWLENSSGSINRVYVVDSVHAFSAGTERAIGLAVSGPLSYATAALS